MNLLYINPINNQQEVLTLNYPNVDYMYYSFVKSYSNDDDLIKILNNTKYGTEGMGGIITKGTMYVGFPRE